jgi:hypothetical protein
VTQLERELRQLGRLKPTSQRGRSGHARRTPAASGHLSSRGLG